AGWPWRQPGAVPSPAARRAVAPPPVGVAPARAPTCSTIHGLNAHGVAATARATSCGSAHATSTTSSGFGSTGPAARAVYTGQISFSTTPDASTARSRNPGTATSRAASSRPSPWRAPREEQGRGVVEHVAGDGEVRRRLGRVDRGALEGAGPASLVVDGDDVVGGHGNVRGHAATLAHGGSGRATPRGRHV